MAKIKAFPATILLLALLFFFLFHIPKTTSKPDGFSLKLIHSNSPMSPSYNRNTTFRERFKTYVRASRARASYWSSFAASNNTVQPDVIQPPLKNEDLRSVVVVRIGIPSQETFLEFDTGSYLSWTQCASCTKCFPQKYSKFDPQLSTSYLQMSCDDPNCKPPTYRCRKNQCVYTSSYVAGQLTKGIASYDTFASEDNQPDQTAANIRFGCSIESSGFPFPPDTVISGILAMSRDTESLPKQLSQQSGGRFSYCLIDASTAEEHMVSFLTFGADIPSTGSDFKKIQFVEANPAHAWVVNLLDISIAGRRMNFPPGTFTSNPDGTGGFIIDTGSPLTTLNRKAYLQIRFVIESLLSRKIFTKISGKYDLCYHYNLPQRAVPDEYVPPMTFHFEGADLAIPSTSTYLFDYEDNTFCLAMQAGSTAWGNILGATQQQDTRFIYDQNENALYFTPEVCGKVDDRA